MRQPPLDAILNDPPSSVDFLLTAVSLPLPEPPASLGACDDTRPCSWVPPASHSPPVSADFEANAIIVMIVLLCALICVLALHAAIRCFLRSGTESSSSRLPHPEPATTSSSSGSAEADQKPAVVRSPPVAYSAGIGSGLAAGPECAICLTEFEEGVGVRVMRRCRHGFHAECIERWLSSQSHPSCPNCRGSCLPPTDSCKQSPQAGAEYGG